jgi:hypothetical protein
MRTKHLLLIFAVLVTGGFTALNTVTSDGDQDFASSKIVIDDFESVKAEKAAKSFEFDASELTNIRTELAAFNGESGNIMDWQMKGPVNIGGRTRALLIDRNDPSVLYAGSVAGGLFKSETNGQYWVPVEVVIPANGDDAEKPFNTSVLSVTSLAQSEDGTVYFTTGDMFDEILITKQGVPSFAGGGLFKKASGSDVFEQVLATDPITENDAFYAITEIAIASNNEMYLATWKGLYHTNNGGSDWSLVSGIPAEYITDVQVNSNNVVIAATKGVVYRKGQGAESFSVVSGSNEGNIEEGGRRYEFCFAPTDPNYLYAIVAAPNDTIWNANGSRIEAINKGWLQGVFKSTDAGSNWIKIGIGGSAEFAVLHRGTEEQTGIESMMIEVSDQDKDYVYVGGVDLWAGYKPPNNEQFQWIRKTYNSAVKTFPLYLTANIHVMAQHPNNNRTYIGCDGGIFRYEEGFGTVPLNNYYTTGLYYDVSYGPKGEYFAGAMDNGMFYNDLSRPGSQAFFGTEIIKEEEIGLQENGFTSFISQYSPHLLFWNHGKTQLRKTVDLGETASEFYTELMETQIVGWHFTWNNGIDYWETNDYTYTNDIYDIKFYDSIKADTTIILKSKNIFGAPIEYYVEGEIKEDSIMPFHDPYKSYMAMGIEGNVWFTAHASDGLVDSIDWVPPFAAVKYYTALASNPNSVRVTNVQFSGDGEYMYFSLLFLDSAKTEIFRMGDMYTIQDSSLYRKSQGRYYPTNEMWQYVQKLGEVSDTEVTSLTVHPTNSNMLVLTTADYNYAEKVFYCANAITTESDDFDTNFRSIQGNLPKVPVFDGSFNIVKDKQFLVGTEVGVWVTNDYTVANPVWQYNSNASKGDLGAVPIMSIKQQVNHPNQFPLVENYGVFYLAAWGKGIFIDETYKQDFSNKVDPENDNSSNEQNGASIEVYPNPVKENFKVRFNMVQDGDASIRIYDISGKVMMQEQMGSYTTGHHVYEVNSADFDLGIYFVEISSNGQKEATRIIKR